jgi:hypothetical protein
LEVVQEIFPAIVLSEKYYDKNMQELFELKLGNMTMDEYERKFLELLRYMWTSSGMRRSKFRGS